MINDNHGIVHDHLVIEDSTNPYHPQTISATHLYHTGHRSDQICQINIGHRTIRPHPCWPCFFYLEKSQIRPQVIISAKSISVTDKFCHIHISHKFFLIRKMSNSVTGQTKSSKSISATFKSLFCPWTKQSVCQIQYCCIYKVITISYFAHVVHKQQYKNNTNKNL